MTDTIQLPITTQERIELGAGLVRFPGTWDEYWELLDKVEYNIEYQNEEIIAMAYETNSHGNIIFETGYLLRQNFSGDQHQGFMENRPVYVQSCHRVYNPDVMMLDQPSQLFQYSPGLNAETNPFIVMEMLSKSTYDHDWEDKLPCYKELPSVEYIVFVESRFPAVTVFTRKPGTSLWEKAFLNEKNESFKVRGHPLFLKDIYRKTPYFK